jgi:hypothetical protein
MNAGIHQFYTLSHFKGLSVSKRSFALSGIIQFLNPVQSRPQPALSD